MRPSPAGARGRRAPQGLDVLRGACALLWLLVGMHAGACSDADADADADAAAGACVPGRVASCPCSGGGPDGVPHFGPMVLSHRPTDTSGAVIYTTFHNDEQADELMKSILYYLIFLL